MNMLDRGKRLSRAATGTVGVAAIAATTALGIHVWGDLQANASGTAVPNGAVPDNTGSDGSSSGDASVPGWSGHDFSGVGPSTGGSSHATSGGS